MNLGESRWTETSFSQVQTEANSFTEQTLVKHYPLHTRMYLLNFSCWSPKTRGRLPLHVIQKGTHGIKTMLCHQHNRNPMQRSEKDCFEMISKKWESESFTRSDFFSLLLFYLFRRPNRNIESYFVPRALLALYTCSSVIAADSCIVIVHYPCG